MSTHQRDYALVAERLSADGTRDERTRRVIDVLWRELQHTGVSWVGFYVHAGGDELLLGPREPKPACSPIGLHGACGRAFRQKAPLIVRDVGELGANYIACDPRDRSEVVVPLVGEDGACWGVLDLDSFAVGAFDERDVAGLNDVLRAAGLTK